MRRLASSLALPSLLISLAAGCGDSNPPVTQTDAGPTTGTDSGPVTSSCPTRDVPNAEETTGACCYRASQADHADSPEMRIRYLDIAAPSASPLASTAVEGVLNSTLGTETFNWLIAMSLSGSDGAVDITTGFGTRIAGPPTTYSFAADGDFPPATISGTRTGDTITSGTASTPVEIPIYDETGTVQQITLILHALRVMEATLSEESSCIGALSGNRFTTAATLEGYVTVEDAQNGTINVPPINTTLCSLIAGELITPSGSDPLCDRDRSEWTAQPDSLCDGETCQANPAGSTEVCDPLTTCNAWRLEANFAAVGVEITP